jgi:16S rRNA (cytidine1402-2'-O)-methyltransferase
VILYAIPTPLGATPQESLPAPALQKIQGIRCFVAENPKTARAFLAAAGMPVQMKDISITTLDEHTSQKDIAGLLQPLRDGKPLGLLSEAGCPAIADPGAALIEAAHREGFRVVPLVGPSSLMLALMASGLEGQRFAFCGYLPREKADRERRIRELEKRSRAEQETEIFIETPYRNDVLLTSLMDACGANTRLCVAADLTLTTESIQTKTVSEWRKSGAAAIGKRPAVFLLYAS